MAWFNGPVQKAFRKQRFFDKEGLFVGDGTYLFVPDNDKYEGSARMLFDESGHPVDSKKLATLSPAQAAKYQWRRCYKLVSLLHTDRAGSFFRFTTYEYTELAMSVPEEAKPRLRAKLKTRQRERLHALGPAPP